MKPERYSEDTLGLRGECIKERERERGEERGVGFLGITLTLPPSLLHVPPAGNLDHSGYKGNPSTIVRVTQSQIGIAVANMNPLFAVSI